MKTYIILHFLLYFPLLLIGQTSAHHGAAKYVPSDGKVLLIMGQDLGAVGGLENYSDGYVDHLGHYPAGVTTYTSLPSLAGLRSRSNWGAGDVNAQEYSDNPNYDHTAIVIGLYMVNQLGRIVAGYVDDEIESLGEWIQEQDRPVFLRIGYEFDGPWNGYDAEQFQEAWRRIVHVFDDMDVRNVAYVWQSAGINTSNIGRWYPGDQYVNWVGYSHFDGSNPGQSIRAFAEEHDKPVMIAEATPRRDLMAGDGQGHWNAWFQPVFESIANNNRIQAFAYINADWDSQPMWQGQGWGDSRVQINEIIETNWTAEISGENWLLASEGLFDDLGYDQWQDSVVMNIEEELDQDFRLRFLDKELSIESSNEAGLGMVQVYGLNGTVLISIHSAEPKIELPITEFLNEVVVVRVINDSGTWTQKVWIN